MTRAHHPHPLRWLPRMPGVAISILIGLMATPAIAQDATADAAVIDAAEFEEFKAARARYSARMSELETDTRSFLDRREADERGKLAEGYDTLIDTLSDLEREQRTIAMDRFQRFLREYPEAAYASHVRFRLADLLWEESHERWLTEHAEYDIIEAELLEEGRFDELPEEPELDLSDSIELYQRIIADSEGLPAEQQYDYLDGTFYMLGFAYKDENAKQRDEEQARRSFERLIDERPDSELVDTAHLYIGNILFDNNRFDDAIARYELVLDKGPDGRHYVDSMYYLAWSFYKMSTVPEDFPRALDMFDRLLDTSHQNYLDSGRHSDYDPDAIKYIAHSFSDISDMTGEDPSQVAEEYFSSRPRREYERDVFVALGDVLVQYGRYQDGIGVYKRLQQDPWHYEPENPDYQFQVVRLLATIAATEIDGDYAASGQARVELAQMYGENTPWWEANRHNPEALQNALSYLEGSLSSVAIEYYNKAKETGTPGDYSLAATQFQEYLDTFPIADDYYEHQWYLAAALYYAQEYQRADGEFDDLIRTAKQHGYGDGATYQSLLARRKLMEDKFGSPDEPPANMEVESTVDLQGGGKLTVYKLSSEHANFIEAVDRVLDHEFAPSDAEGAFAYEELSSAVAKNRPAFMYIAGQILFHHNRFEEALPRLKAVVDRFPERNEASYAAGLVLDSYTAMHDLAELRRHAKIYAAKQLGESEDRAQEFANLEEGAAFKQAQALIDAEEREAGAEAYLAFHGEYPDSEYAPDALLNAGNNFQRVGKADRALEIFKQFVATYPENSRSEGLYLRIASNAESLFELDDAIFYYEELVRRFPDRTENASAAQYNAAFLRIGKGDHLGAAQAFQRYSVLFPERPDREEVYFMAGEQYEAVGPSEAATFYQQYLREFGTTYPDHALKAKQRLATSAADRGDEGEANKYRDEILRDFDAMIAAGAEVGWEGRKFAAESKFRDLQATYDAFILLQLTGEEAKDVPLLLDVVPARLSELEDESNSFIAKYGDFDYSLASLYLVAAAYLYSADLIYNMDCPSNLSEEECDIYMEIVYSEFYPRADAIQEKAIARFDRLTQTAADRKQYNEWVTKSKETLNQLDPFNYPAQKVELPGGTDATIYPDVVPKKVGDLSSGGGEE